MFNDPGFLGFVAFAGFRAHAEYDNAQLVWDELPEEIRDQWRAAADAVIQHAILRGLTARPPNPEATGE